MLKTRLWTQGEETVQMERWRVKVEKGKKNCFEGHRRPGVEWEIQGNAFCSKENVLKRKKVSNAAGNEQRRHGLWLLSIVPYPCFAMVVLIFPRDPCYL